MPSARKLFTAGLLLLSVSGCVRTSPEPTAGEFCALATVITDAVSDQVDEHNATFLCLCDPRAAEVLQICSQ